MIKGEFLVCDDLGPLGRLVAPGELEVLEPRDAGKVLLERKWIGEKYLEADRKAEYWRKRMKTSSLGEHHAQVRENFEMWTIEAAKLALCDRFLLAVAGKLDMQQRQAMDLKKSFRFADLPQIRDVVQRVLSASDEEITGGTSYRAA